MCRRNLHTNTRFALRNNRERKPNHKDTFVKECFCGLDCHFFAKHHRSNRMSAVVNAESSFCHFFAEQASIADKFLDKLRVLSNMIKRKYRRTSDASIE